MFLLIYSARLLGASGWGVFSYALSIGSILIIFSDIGLSGLTTREIIQKKEDYKNYVSTIFLLKFIILVISITLVIFIGPQISNIDGLNNLFLIVSVILFFDSLRDFGIAINRSSEKMEREMIVKIIMNLTILILGIILLRINPTPISIAKAYAIGTSVGFVVIFLMIKNDIKNIFSKINTSLIKSILKTTWPFAVINLIGSIMANTDIYMLGIWKNPSEIGLYASVQRIQSFIIIIPSMIATASFPIMSKLANIDDFKFRQTLEKTMILLMAICIPIIFGGIILASQIVPFVFGAEYIKAVPIFQIFMITMIASFPLVLLSNSIFAYNKQKNVTNVYILGVIINIIINIILIPKFGGLGSAIATLFSTILITFFHWKSMKKINNFEIIPKLYKIIISSISMSIFILIFKYQNINIIINITLSSVLYLLFLYLTKDKLLENFLKNYEKN